MLVDYISVHDATTCTLLKQKNRLKNALSHEPIMFVMHSRYIKSFSDKYLLKVLTLFNTRKAILYLIPV